MSADTSKMISSKYNDNGKLTYYKTDSGYEVWFTYDDRGNMIERRDSEGSIDKYLHDKDGNLIPFEKYML